MSPGFYSGNDDYSLPTTSATVYSSLSVSDSTFAVPVTSSLAGYDTDLTAQFLADDVLLTDDNAALNCFSSLYPGQIQTQDLLNPGYMPMEVPMYNPGTMNNSYPADMSWLTHPLTPPPEDYVQEVLPHHFLSAEHFQDEHCRMDKDVPLCEGNDMSKPSPYRSDRSKFLPRSSTNVGLVSLQRRSLVQPRPIRSASERSDTIGMPRHLPTEIRTPSDEPFGDRVKARSDPLYDAKPDKDGWYHCPMYKETKCVHKPTKQKCIFK